MASFDEELEQRNVEKYLPHNVRGPARQSLNNSLKQIRDVNQRHIKINAWLAYPKRAMRTNQYSLKTCCCVSHATDHSFLEWKPEVLGQSESSYWWSKTRQSWWFKYGSAQCLCSWICKRWRNKEALTDSDCAGAEFKPEEGRISSKPFRLPPTDCQTSTTSRVRAHGEMKNVIRGKEPLMTERILQISAGLPSSPFLFAPQATVQAPSLILPMWFHAFLIPKLSRHICILKKN